MAKLNNAYLDNFGKLPEDYQKKTDYRVHNTILRAQNYMTLQESKLFHLFLAEVYRTQSDTVELNKRDVFDTLGLTGGDRWDRYRDIFKGLKEKSAIEFYDPEKKLNYLGSVMTEVIFPESEKSKIILTTGTLLKPYLLKLLNTSAFLYLDEVINFKSDFSLRLYLYFKSWNRYNAGTDEFESNMRYLTTKQLFALFNLDSDAYHRKDGKFDRYTFERYTIQVACKEISENTSIECALHHKTKGRRGEVENYVFIWDDHKNARRGGIERPKQLPEFTDGFESEKNKVSKGQVTIDEI